MSDLGGRSSFGSNTGPQSITRPKFQPIRLKALLHFCESDDDDDDDDDNDDKSQGKVRESSEDESDSDEPLPSNDYAEDVLQETFRHEATVDSTETDAKEREDFSRTIARMPPEASREIATDVSSTQKRIFCPSDREECEVGNVNLECRPFLVEELNKPEAQNDGEREEKTQECHSGTLVSRSHQADAVHDRCLTDVAPPPPPPPSLTAYKSDYSVKPDDARNAHALDRRKEEHATYVAESKRLLAASGESCLLNLSKEDGRRPPKSYVEQTSQLTTREEEAYRRATSSSAVGSESHGNENNPTLAAAARYSGSAQYGVARYETSEKQVLPPAENSTTRTEFNTSSLNDTAKKRSLNAFARSTATTAIMVVTAAETPLKHRPAQVGPTHSHPCAAHKQLFRTTPQSKLLSGEQSGKSHVVQTPSSAILSNWRHSGSAARHTPMDGKSSLIPKDQRVQTPRDTAVYTPVVGAREPSRHFGMDAKNARRPLMDAMLARGDSSIYPLESKPPLLQTRSGTKCPSVTVTSELQQEDKSRKTIGLCTEKKLMQIAEANYENDMRSANPVEETKENKQPNILDALIGNAMEIAHDNKKEDKQMAIGPGASSKAMQDSSRRYDGEENVVSSTERKADSHDHYTVRERQREELRQIVDKVANVQFTVPTSVPAQRQGKTLFVKDREYLILGCLGRGMSGEVLRVQDLSCGELRAIKCVDLNKMDRESGQGCLDEISLLRKLQAPCVVRMFDYHIRESMVYVVMEMGDTDLSRLLKSMSQEKQIPLMMILYYWTEMLTAVKHIHDNGVIHSDLKPANFLLVRGRLKLIDFGIASNINSDMTSVLKNNPIGTLNYISPEALMDIGGSADSPTHKVKYKISFKSDVWSLGCILYSLVYGHTPFYHIRSQWAKINAITNLKPNISFPASMFSSGEPSDCERTPPVLIDVMRKCLQHDPKARPTVSQLLQVQYVPTKDNVAPNRTPDIPANVLVKIKYALTEEEWRQLSMQLSR